MRSKTYLYSFLQLTIFLLSLATDWYGPLLVVLFVLTIIMMLDKLGKGVVLREIIALHSCFICLIMPLIGYRFFTSNNPLARLWVKYMPVTETIYFGYALPAIAAFILLLCWPINNSNRSDEGLLLKQAVLKAKNIVSRQPKTGLYLVVTGLIMSRIAVFLPPAFQFVFNLFYFAAFAGFLYVYYTSSSWYRLPVLFLFAALILVEAIRTGMFTIVAYMGLTLFSFFFLGRQTRLWKKLLWFSAGIFALLMLQLVKPAYRQLTWKGNYSGNKALLLSDLVGEKLTEFDWQSADAFFPVYVRTNQGFNVALVMRRIPSLQPFDNGNRLFLTFASALVPRFLWPDKPEAGGRFNMKYYAGYVIKGWSTNVGPLGEAYGSFGVTGGIIFMLFLGAFIRWAYAYVFLIARKIPIIIFWIPVLFFQTTYSAESDTLQVMNSLIKSALFIFLLYKLLPSTFGIVKRYSHVRNRLYSTQVRPLPGK